MINPVIFDDFWSNPGIILVLILVVFGLVALLVFLLRKYVPFFKSDEKVKTPEEIAKEEVDRLVEDLDEELEKEADTLEKERKKEESQDSYHDDSLERTLSSVEDEKTAEAMEQYRLSHPEEEEAIKNDENKKEEKKG